MENERNPVAHFLRAQDAVRGGRLDEAEAFYRNAIALEPEFSMAHLRLAELLLQRGRRDEAVAEVRAGYRPVSGQVTPYRGQGDHPTVLQIGSASVKGLTGTEHILDPMQFETTTVIAQYWDPEAPLPPHDLAINLIADPDIDAGALAMAAWLLKKTSAPVINPPALIGATSRTVNPGRLGRIPNVIAPGARLVARSSISMPSSLPLLLRSPGYHNGAHFERVDRADELTGALAKLPGEDLLLIDYVDTCDDAGRYFKYRAMIVDGVPYPAHLAISNSWNVHYFSAQMGEFERERENSYLRDLPAHLGERATVALAAIGRILELDYVGVDFGIARNGELVVFEANAAMTIFLPDSSEENTSRRAAAQAIFGAAQAMLRSRIESANRRSR